jgi:predicted HicB family RNase H-like nuclease
MMNTELLRQIASIIEMPEETVHELDQFYSGRFSVRVPKSLHRLLAERAVEEGCSLNQLVTTIFSSVLAKPDKIVKSDKIGTEKVSGFFRGKVTPND